ncbi:hypothetical protein BaRGS_00013532, partial [Batillaria attramentaria]
MPEDEDEYGSSYSFPYNGRYRTARICSFDAYDLPPLTPYHSFRVHIYPGHKVVGNIPVSSSCSLVRPSKKRGKWMEKRKSSDDATVNDKFEIVALWIREKGKLLEVREIPDDPADDKFEAARRFASKNWLEIVGLWFKFCLYYIFCCCVGRSKKPSLPQDNPYTVLNESVYSVTAPEPCDMARSGQDIKPENPEVKETAKDESDLANRLL